MAWGYFEAPKFTWRTKIFKNMVTGCRLNGCDNEIWLHV